MRKRGADGGRAGIIGQGICDRDSEGLGDGRVGREAEEAASAVGGGRADRLRRQACLVHATGIHKYNLGCGLAGELRVVGDDDYGHFLRGELGAEHVGGFDAERDEHEGTRKICTSTGRSRVKSTATRLRVSSRYEARGRSEGRSGARAPSGPTRGVSARARRFVACGSVQRSLCAEGWSETLPCLFRGKPGGRGNR